MSSTIKLIKKQQRQTAVDALTAWSKKHGTNDVPDLVLHVLNLAVDKCQLKGVAKTVEWIEDMIRRHDGMEKTVEKFVKRMVAEDEKEIAKKRKQKKHAAPRDKKRKR